MKKRFMLLLVFTTLLFCGVAAAALAWERPVVGEPYDWSYQDAQRSIAINRVQSNDVVYFVADVQITDVSVFRAELSGGMAPVSALAKKAGAVLAINGDDYGTHKYGVIVRNGELLRAHDTTRNLLALDANGDMHVKTDRKGEEYQKLGQQLLNAGVWQTFEFGPELVRDGQAVPFSPDFDVISTKASRMEPRTAIGQIGPLHYLLVVVDGRQDGYSVGMTLQELQTLFVDYGAQTAMNLDGGGSAEIWFQGEVLNKPAGGQERHVSDIICF